MPMPYVEELYSCLDAQPDKGNFWGAMPYPIDTRDYPEDAPLHKALLNSMGHRDDSFYAIILSANYESLGRDEMNTKNRGVKQRFQIEISGQIMQRHSLTRLKATKN